MKVLNRHKIKQQIKEIQTEIDQLIKKGSYQFIKEDWLSLLEYLRSLEMLVLVYQKIILSTPFVKLSKKERSIQKKLLIEQVKEIMVSNTGSIIVPDYFTDVIDPSREA